MHTKQAFLKYGYLQLPAVFSEQEVLALRERIEQYGSEGRIIQTSEVLKDAILRRVIENAELRSVVQKIFGEEIVYYPSVHVQKNSFTQSSNRYLSGLHIDASEELNSASLALVNQLPTWVNVGVYMQDWYNGGFGGGILIVPKSHLLIKFLSRFPYGNRIANFTIKALRRLPILFTSIVKTNAGDVIIFDNRLIHASFLGPNAKKKISRSKNPYQNSISSLPTEHRKYAFYWFASPRRNWGHVIEHNFLSRVKSPDQVFEKDAFDYQAFKQSKYQVDWEER